MWLRLTVALPPAVPEKVNRDPEANPERPPFSHSCLRQSLNSLEHSGGGITYKMALSREAAALIEHASISSSELSDILQATTQPDKPAMSNHQLVLDESYNIELSSGDCDYLVESLLSVSSEVKYELGVILTSGYTFRDKTHITVHNSQTTDNNSVKQLLSFKATAANPVTARSNSSGTLLTPQGGLIDSLISLQQHSLINLNAVLTLNLDPAVTLTLTLSASLLPAIFTAAHSPAKQLFVNHVFHSRSESKAKSQQQASVHSFYQALHRAPRTVDGLITPSPDATRHRDASARSQAESAEERAARERRAAKGKARAVEPDSASDQHEKEEEDELLGPVGLVPTLMGFQSRSLRWLLAREGKFVAPAAVREAKRQVKAERGGADEVEEEEEPQVELSDLPDSLTLDLARGPLWEPVTLPSVNGGPTQSFWINRVTSELSLDDPAKILTQSNTPFCGMLCEEVGLGKTVEIISLILLHRQPERTSLSAYHSPTLDADVQPSGLTLIIAPAPIVEQWESELERHAPRLRVLRYDAVGKLKKHETAERIAEDYDVILTTYNTMRREVHFARKPHERARRAGRGEKQRYRRGVSGRPCACGVCCC